MATVHKHDVPAGFVGLWQVLLVDPVGQGCCRGVVHQLQNIQPGHPSSEVLELVIQLRFVIVVTHLALSSRALLSASVK